MLRAQPGSIEMPTAKQTGFVPEMYLSTYVHDQLSALHHCDTITVDPHKSGFCPYPGGAICYRDRRMNSFLSIATKVLYYHGKMILGDIGIEGSKPGASAVAVMMANRVSFYPPPPAPLPRKEKKDEEKKKTKQKKEKTPNHGYPSFYGQRDSVGTILSCLRNKSYLSSLEAQRGLSY